jgi:hypothetical protein
MFEREGRIQRLLDAGIIKSPEDIPADAIPAQLEYVTCCRASLSLQNRPPYFADQRFCCTDCHQWFVWPADAQRQWYEDPKSSPYSTAARCQRCRRRRRGVREKTK